MKKLLVLSLLTISVGIKAIACDMCGCATSSQYLGILPIHYKHLIGLQYAYTGFSVWNNASQKASYEWINTTQIWGRYSINKSIQLFAFIPYHVKTGNDGGRSFNISGIGDASVLGNWTVVKQSNFSGKWQHNLMLGGGIKLSTGKYTGTTELDKAGLPNIQAGTGTIDFIINTNYSLWYNKWGLNTDASYMFTTVGKDSYKYGNKLTSSLLIFRNIEKGKWTVLPQLGLRYEYTLHDYDNYNKKWLNENSGGHVLYNSIGIQTYFNRWGGKVVYNQPIISYLGNGRIDNRPKMEAGIFFLL